MKAMTHIMRAATTPLDSAAGLENTVCSSHSLSSPDAPIQYTCHDSCQDEAASCTTADYPVDGTSPLPRLATFNFQHAEMRISAEIWQDCPGAVTARVAMNCDHSEETVHFFRLPIADRPDLSKLLRGLAERLDTALRAKRDRRTEASYETSLHSAR